MTAQLAGLLPAIRTYEQLDLFERSILIGWRGSVAHGTYIKEHIDDLDTFGIVVLPQEYYFGLANFGSKETKTITHNEWDILFYSLKKYVYLLLKSNPNVLGLLWLREDMYLRVTDEGRQLIEHRDKFISKEIYKSFCGYAFAQIQKMTRFKREGYMGKKRMELVDRFGYDCKNAAHAVRLLKMGAEALESGKIQVYRQHDRDMLLDIKNGRWELEDVKTYVEGLKSDIDKALKRSDLPAGPDKEFINKLLIDLTRSKLGMLC